MQIICNSCKRSLRIIRVQQFGDDVRLGVESCDCEWICDPTLCDKLSEMEMDVTATMIQQAIDIEGNDEIIQKIRKLGQKFGGIFEKGIEDILEGD